MKLPPQLEKLSQVKHAKVIGILMTILVDMLLLAVAIMIGGYPGYYVMMIGLVVFTFATLYLFGWRKGKDLAVIGMGMFLLVGSIYGPIMVYTSYSQAEPEPVTSYYTMNWFTKQVNTDIVDDNGTFIFDGHAYKLDNGTLDKYRGEPGDNYRFSVVFYSNDTVTPTVSMGYARDIWGFDGTLTLTASDTSDMDLSDGKEFHYILNLDKPGIYYYWFAVVFDSGADTISLNTTHAQGPLVGSQVDNWGTYIPIGAVTMFCNIGLLFLIIVLLYWWIGTAKEKRKVWDQALREKEDGPDSGPKPFTCDQCGAPVGVEDNFCPKCGERFDEVEGDEKPGTSPIDEPPKEIVEDS